MGLAKTQNAITRDIAERVSNEGAQVIVFWGSQSGTAEGYAHRLVRDLHCDYKVKVTCADMSDFNPATFVSLCRSVRCVFLVSTFGEGEPSDNASDFFSWIEGSAPVSLNGARYAAFGCGNSNYRYFNKTVDDLANFLDRNGAVAMTSVVRGDEALGTTEEDFLEWKDHLMMKISLELGLELLDKDYIPRLKIEELTSEVSAQTKTPPIVTGGGHTNVNLVQVVSARKLARYSRKDQSVLEITVDYNPYPQVKYKTGDHIAIWPENSEEEISHLLSLLDLKSKRSTPIKITEISGVGSLKVPGVVAIDTLFRRFLDICGPVSRETVLDLSRVAPTEKIREVLKGLGKDRKTYAMFLETRHITFARLLSHTLELDASASWHSLPLSFVVKSLPPMKPRLYSISSSTIVSPKHVSLTVSLKPEALRGNPETSIPGLARDYLSTCVRRQLEQPAKSVLTPSLELWAQLRSSTFKLPVRSHVPLIMVAAGTGIAPFRAFTQERSRLSMIGQDVGRMILFYGCQSDNDYLYRQELEEFMKGPLKGKLEVVTAFSRSQIKKIYVQDQVAMHIEKVNSLMLDHDAAFYVCGAATMAKEVIATMIEGIKEHSGWQNSQLDSWRTGLKSSKRWFEDVWG
jgi:NADPH-ferrihemoprotein reductase